VAYTHHERLSAVDSSFLALEDANAHMHIGAVAEFEAAPLTGSDGRLDVARIERAIEASLHRFPRYRQRLEWVPLLDHPVWVDDASFNFPYHVRHTCLPPPGDERQLKRLAGRILSQQLDRGKPLWELWIVEGLASGRIAIVTKVHHCMIDGVGSVELTGLAMQASADPDPRLSAPAPRWMPRPAPSKLQLVRGEVQHRVAASANGLAVALRSAAHPIRAATTLYSTVEGIVEAVTAGLRPASPTPLNVEIGPHRRFDWCEGDLDRVKRIKERLGGTVNDVVLAIVSGAIRRFLRQRGLAPADLDFRAMIPVNIRRDGDHTVGNRVAMLVARLPLDAGSPRERLARVIGETRGLKRSHQAAGMEAIEEVGDATFTSLFVEFARASALNRPFNLVVTNVPGPPFPIYMLGARMLACHPLVPLFRGQALGIALFSYDGRLFWGCNADWDAVPDLHDLVAAIDVETAHLADAAEASLESPPESA
jgi:diacylglycerol O-acyltransferase / wax synthase